MTTKKVKKLVHEHNFAAEVEVELIYTQDEWSPYLSIQDAYKLDEVRQALIQKDFQTVAMFGQVYQLTPVVAFA